ncbi:MAG TPA: HD domain-containing phosphohydrolase [Candidatus Bathyarchaeia archaeon]|nr:HD domain-containing phosphohydrolase [Candidatus Bathyarchaeia archaeon]
MSLEDLRPGMRLGIGMHNREGHVLLGPGVSLTSRYIARLRELGCSAVWIDDEDTRDIPYERILTDTTRMAASEEIQNTFAMAAREAPAFRGTSAREIVSAVEGRRTQQKFESAPSTGRLLAQVDTVVGEVLDRPVLTGLNSIRSHDTYIFDHSLDVMTTATVIGKLLGYDRGTLRKLAVGSLLHDIGKIFVDDAILRKAGRYTEEEAQRVRDHCVLGYLFVRDSLRLGVLAAHMAYQHHERQDGTGYPRGLTGTNRIVHGLEIHVPGHINPLAEIVAIADFHDARSSNRPHRPASPPDQVWRMIRDRAGTHLNREMVELFLSVLPPYPVGTRVAVTSGRWQGHLGVVARFDRHAMTRPVIRILSDQTGRRLEPFEIDLTRDEATIAGAGSLKEALV